jgi:hypothetical protein
VRADRQARSGDAIGWPVVQTGLMPTVLVSLPSGAGLVRRDDGSVLVTNRVPDGGGMILNDADPFSPGSIGLDERHSVVGGLLPPGAVNVEAVDDRGTRVIAAVENGAYVAVLEQAVLGIDPVVCCRDAAGKPVRRPWAQAYPSVRVTDATVPCPACGAIDYDEYTPFEDWRGGSGSKVNGTLVPNPVVSCRACGHEEREGTFFGGGANPDESEDEATRAARIVRTRAQLRKRRWLTNKMTIRATQFPIYAADGWPAEIGGSESRDDQQTGITIHHYEAGADRLTGDRPRLAITTKHDEPFPSDLFTQLNQRLQDWIRRGESWPDASRAAITLWMGAHNREVRAAALAAVQSEQLITIDDIPTTMLVLSTPHGRWVAAALHDDLTLIIAADDVSPTSLRLEPIADPITQLLGPEPPDA